MPDLVQGGVSLVPQLYLKMIHIRLINITHYHIRWCLISIPGN